MPPLIGDSIMTFPLINRLKLEYNLTLVCNEYVYETVKFLQNPLKSKFISVDKIKDKIIIDFLSNRESAAYIRFSNPKLSIGFHDGFHDYDLLLKQPTEFNTSQAHLIFLYALDVLGIKTTYDSDFSCSFKWKYTNQSEILLSPGAGNISRCFAIEDFVRLSAIINCGKTKFILGPNDKELAHLIPKEFEIISTKNIEETINILASAKMVVSSEGGFMHIAASYGIPLIGLFKVTSVRNWFPYSNKYQIGIGDGENNYSDKTEGKMNLKLISKKVTEIYESIRD